ncbi:MAG: cobaltochelatase subunit CobN, partial [Desulfarculaceae bacterium]
ERIDHVCRRLKKWLRLRRLSNSEKRITFVLHNAPCKGVEATVGLGVGLDVFQSLARTLQAMKQAGYDVGEAPAQGKAILDHIMDKKAISEFRWTTVDEIVRKGGVLHMTDREEYQPFLESLPPQARSKLLEDWEDFPGQGMVYSREDGEEVLLITGVKYGKVRIMLQPKRGCYGPKCTGEVCRILHDPNLAPPHHWLAAYKYIQDNSDAVVHFGCHGALEFLPGKRAGLSRECFSDISLGDLPNIYPYVMDVPGEGLVAKRRGNAVIIDHLTPAYRPTGLDQQTGRLVNILEQYQRALDMEEAQRAELLQGEALPLLRELKLVEEDYQGETDFPETVDRALRQMKLSQDHLAPEGLHLLGLPPEPQEEAMMLAGICQRDQEIAALLADVTQKRGGDPEDFDDRSLVFKDLIGGQVAAGELGKDSDLQALEHWALNASALIRQSREEIEQVLSALDGGYIKPGLSGSLMMGKIQALPTGRNFFAVDVAALPTRAAWETGCGMADQLLLRHLNQEGRIPESVGHNLWSIDAFKSDGELLCMILYLMGARPLWDSQDRVTGIEAIPLSELFLETGEGEIQQRPRVDVLVQTSGIVRDMVPNFIELLDQAVMLIGSLDEGPDSNYIRRHNSERLEQLRQELNGDADPDHLLRLASYRVFTSPPGSYGIGVGLAIDASAWESDQDLAEVYVNWGGYAYGQGAYGLEAHDLYAGHLQNIDVSYMKQYSPEYDLLDCGCYASYQGGMSLAAKAVGGKDTKLYWSDNSASGQADICDLKTGLETAFRAKLNNQRWIENMKKHGFQGAMAVSNKVNNLFKWSVTSRQVDKWLFDAVTENFIQNPENLAWLRENNPYALEEITRRLLEAESRGLWEASPDLLAAVQAAALAVEGDMEEVMGEVTEEFQGSKVEILTAQQVEKWQPTWRLGQG